MHPTEIQAAIKRAGVSQSELARQCGVSPSAIGSVVKGRTRAAALEQKVSEITGIPLTQLWPQWYGESGGSLQVSGDGNVVAGRDQVGIRESVPSYGVKLSVAEERWLRLLRALEPAQQDEVEKFMRQKIAGG